MMPSRSTTDASLAAILRLNALSPLDPAARTALHQAAAAPRRYRAHREIQAEGKEITETLLILDGWAARARLLPDGRRQVVSLLLPGDLIGACNHERPLATVSMVALTDVEACVAPDPFVSPTLKRAYGFSGALDEAYLVAHVTRLGRLDAQERIADLLLELLERLELAGLAAKGRFTMPMTQEVLADVLGLTTVHVNRTLQALRRAGVIDWKGRDLSLKAPDALRRNVGRIATRVTADPTG